MTAAQLKASILDQAIRGKLVPQDPKDEPAEKLLERIRNEELGMRNGRVGGGRGATRPTAGRGTRPACPPITEEEKPFDLPKGWAWCRLNTICDKIVDGDHNPPPGISSKTEYMMLSSRNVCDDGVGELDKVRYLTEAVFRQEDERTFAREGDIFFTSVGTIGRSCVYSGGGNVCFQRSVTVLHTLIFNKYLKYYFDSPAYQEYARDHSIGTAQVGFYLKEMSLSPVALPPLSEQKRIVAKVEELLPLVEKYGAAYERKRKLIADLPEKLRKSILQEAIQGKLVPQDPKDEPAEKLLERIAEAKAKGEQTKGRARRSATAAPQPITDEEKPFDLPKGWAWCRLGEIGAWGSGATPAKGVAEYHKNGTIPWLLTGDLNDSVVYDIPHKITEKALNETSVKLNPAGSVLIAMYGATIGKVSILGVEATTNQACCACIPNDCMFNWYLFYYLLSQREMFRKRGEGGAQPNISKEKIIATLIPLPPLAEQKRIVAKVEELLADVEQLKKVVK